MQNKLEIAAPGRLDGAGAEILAHQLDAAIRNGHYFITLSMAQTGFLSSAGIRVLLTYQRQLARLGGRLTLHDANAMARATLELSGLAGLLAAPDARPACRPASESAAPDSQAMPASPDLELGIVQPKAFLDGWRVGCPPPPNQARTNTPDWLHLAPAADCYAVGLGAFGAPADCPAHAGELICAAGAAVCRPPGDKIPDYLLQPPGAPPELHALYLAGYTGAFAACARFRAGAAGDFSLTALVRAISVQQTWPAMGFAMIAETAGVVGAARIWTSNEVESDVDFFEFPGIRHRLAFTPEPEYAGDLAVVIGMVFRGLPPPADWQPFVRPWHTADGMIGHAHAAILTYRALPAGRPACGALLRELLEQSKLRAVLHLVNDNRPATGAGESRFRNGLLWCGPLRTEPT